MKYFIIIILFGFSYFEAYSAQDSIAYATPASVLAPAPGRDSIDSAYPSLDVGYHYFQSGNSNNLSLGIEHEMLNIKIRDKTTFTGKINYNFLISDDFKHIIGFSLFYHFNKKNDFKISWKSIIYKISDNNFYTRNNGFDVGYYRNIYFDSVVLSPFINYGYFVELHHLLNIGIKLSLKS
jgi:hypothetical protein